MGYSNGRASRRTKKFRKPGRRLRMQGRRARRRTGAKSQGRQISRLYKAVARIKDDTTVSFSTQYQMINIAVGNLTTGLPGSEPSVYICPIDPCGAHNYWAGPGGTSGVQACDNHHVTGTNGGNLINHVATFAWQPNITNIAQLKIKSWNLSYKLETTETDLTEVTVSLIRPRAKQADGLVKQCGFKSTIKDWGAPTGVEWCNPGLNSFLQRDEDYTYFDGVVPAGAAAQKTMTGVMFNLKKWEVIFKKVHRLQLPAAQGVGESMHPNIVNPNYNFRTQYGSHTYNQNLTISGTNRYLQSMVAGTGQEASYLDIPNESQVMLVVLCNDETVDLGATVRMTFQVMCKFNGTMGNASSI